MEVRNNALRHLENIRDDAFWKCSRRRRSRGFSRYPVPRTGRESERFLFAIFHAEMERPPPLGFFPKRFFFVFLLSLFGDSWIFGILGIFSSIEFLELMQIDNKISRIHTIDLNTFSAPPFFFYYKTTKVVKALWGMPPPPSVGWFN